MGFSQTDPTAKPSVAFRQGNGIEFDPILICPANPMVIGLSDHKMPMLAT